MSPPQAAAPLHQATSGCSSEPKEHDSHGWAARLAGAAASARVACAEPFVPVDQAPCDGGCQRLTVGEQVRAGRRYAAAVAAGFEPDCCACVLDGQDVVA
jgi:hypothetical protein